MNIEKLVRPNIVSLTPYSSARDEYSDVKSVLLDANENPLGVFNRYPDPYQKTLKEQIAKLKNVSASNIFLGNGSDEIIDIAYRIFCEPGIDKALVFTPTYGIYEIAANINNVEVVKVTLNEHFDIEKSRLENYLKDENLKLVFICSPNNPTGNLLDIDAIEFLLNNFNGIVVIDEAYIDFSNRPSFSLRLQEFPNLIVCQTLSKAWAMAGLRVGVAFMSEAILKFYNKVKPPYNISSLNQQKALESLQNLKEYNDSIDMILQEKSKLKAALEQLHYVKKIYPSDSNFILIQVDDATILYQYLKNNKIVIRNRHTATANCLRITIGTPEENEKLITQMVSFTNTDTQKL